MRISPFTFLIQDFRENFEVAPSNGRLGTVLTARFVSVLVFRWSQLLGRRSGALAGMAKQLNQLLTGADMAWRAEIGPGLVLFHPVGTVIGPFVKIGRQCHLQQGVTIGGPGRPTEAERASPVIGDNVLLGAGAKCFGDIQIGSGAVVGANAVVRINVPAGGTAVGVPARVVGPDPGGPAATGD